MTIVIGVLALQGAFIEHVRHIEKCIIENKDHYREKLTVVTVRDNNQLTKCDALIIPGGESTAMSLIAERTGFYDDLHAFVHNPKKVTWGTCAGLIYLSQQLSNEEKLVRTLNLLKVKVKRNAFGRQAQSSTRICDFSDFIPYCDDFPATFIRAPVIDEVLDPEDVQVLYKLHGRDNGGQELIVAAKQKDNILATSFHPELAENDLRFHDWFIREFVLKNFNKQKLHLA
ncbi:CPI_1c_G0030780.mRNA.1.CDS.1 [Saccharomyces cerevisiae]|nr:CPI_1c_G0030780.mRNA.1.CDS.1 [Saccharomyces cerevisiae]CAI7369547.1 CPI_1c_G0030780.mRNA.1.CDS.1 [Saccharomyces cerevisiae]